MSLPSALSARLGRFHRLLAVVITGFASGLPLALTGQALQAWLTQDGLDVATIGFLSLVGLPYTFKFLWAPLMDRFEPWPALGRRRGWLVLTQLALGGALLLLARTPPADALALFALLAVAVAFLSASQDVVIDAWRTDLLPASERGIGASVNVLGYRLAMILSGGVALIWTDPVQGSGMSWPEVYRLMAGLMAGAAVCSLLLLPRIPLLTEAPRAEARHDLAGFAAVMAAVVAGYLFTQQVAQPLAAALLAPLWEGGTVTPALRTRWADLLALLAGLALTLPLAGWAARRARFETLLGGLRGYFSQPQAGLVLAFIVAYKLGDAFAGTLLTPFLLKGVGYASAEVGVVNKVLGLWLSIGGALLGGVLMMRLGLWRALLLFGLLQAASNLGFWWLAVHGRGQLPGLVLPAFDWGFVALAQATPVDGGLLAVIALENLTGGMGTAAFLALLMSLTQQRFSATQFAMLSAFASVGRVWVGPLAGVLAESLGWPTFFIVSLLMAVPGLLLLLPMRATLQRIAPSADTARDD
ncbi:MAG: hypothetical protein RLY78_2165 [Pseudomonadota bacterium]|jgi:PAT family beta-lactamase induction signal transducer AmpG